MGSVSAANRNVANILNSVNSLIASQERENVNVQEVSGRAGWAITNSPALQFQMDDMATTESGTSK